MARFPASMVASASAGDRVSIDALLALAQPDIRRYARRKCRTASDAEDAVQETLFVLFRHFSALRRVESLSAWLFVVVYRQCMRLASFIMPLAVDVADADREGRLRDTPDAELRIDLAQAIQSLPQNYRDVILLRDVEEMTIDEIASQLASTRESVKARLNRARSMLREYLLD
ncbi:Sigma-70 family RNA polymerase sigma factor [Sphingomonas antarctica]